MHRCTLPLICPSSVLRQHLWCWVRSKIVEADSTVAASTVVSVPTRSCYLLCSESSLSLLFPMSDPMNSLRLAPIIRFGLACAVPSFFPCFSRSDCILEKSTLSLVHSLSCSPKLSPTQQRCDDGEEMTRYWISTLRGMTQTSNWTPCGCKIHVPVQ